MQRIRRFAQRRQPTLTATVLVAIGIVIGAGLFSNSDAGVTLRTSLSSGSRAAEEADGGDHDGDVEMRPVDRGEPLTVERPGVTIPRVTIPPLPDCIEVPFDLPVPEVKEITPPVTMPEPFGDRHPIFVTVKTDQPFYQDGSAVRITAELCNLSNRTHRYETYREQELRVTILDASGQPIAGHFAPSRGAYVIAWEPGECKSFGPFSWWQEKHHFSGEPGHGFIPPRPGAHTAQVVFAETPVPEDGEPRMRTAPRTEGSASFELDGVTVDVTTDKRTYAAGELVKATAHVCNPTDRPQAQTFTWDPEAEFRVVRDGSGVAQSETRGPVEMYTRQFGSRECVDYTFTWDRAEAAPGTYEIELLWWGHDNPSRASEPGRYFFVPERVPFELV